MDIEIVFVAFWRWHWGYIFDVSNEKAQITWWEKGCVDLCDKNCKPSDKIYDSSSICTILKTCSKNYKNRAVVANLFYSEKLNPLIEKVNYEQVKQLLAFLTKPLDTAFLILRDEEAKDIAEFERTQGTARSNPFGMRASKR